MILSDAPDVSKHPLHPDNEPVDEMTKRYRESAAKSWNMSPEERERVYREGVAAYKARGR
jgi:hypothetical protein